MYPRVKYPRIFCTPHAKYPKDIWYPVGKKCTPIERLALMIGGAFFTCTKKNMVKKSVPCRFLNTLQLRTTLYTRFTTDWFTISLSIVAAPSLLLVLVVAVGVRHRVDVEHYLTATTSKKTTRSTATKMEQRLLLHHLTKEPPCAVVKSFHLSPCGTKKGNSVNYTIDLPLILSIPAYFFVPPYIISYKILCMGVQNILGHYVWGVNYPRILCRGVQNILGYLVGRGVQNLQMGCKIS